MTEYNYAGRDVNGKVRSSTARYVGVVGTAELAFFEWSDERALRVVDRWVRLFWPRFRDEGHRWSMAYAINQEAKTVEVYRQVVNDIGVIQCGTDLVRKSELPVRT